MLSILSIAFQRKAANINRRMNARSRLTQRLSCTALLELGLVVQKSVVVSFVTV